MTKNALFCVFSPFLSSCLTAWWPYSLSHIDALRINLSYLPKDQSLKFSRKNIENWGVENLSFFELVIYNFFFQKENLLHPNENSKDFLKFWWLPWFPVQNNTWYATQCMWEKRYCDLEGLDKSILNIFVFSKVNGRIRNQSKDGQN